MSKEIVTALLAEKQFPVVVGISEDGIDSLKHTRHAPALAEAINGARLHGISQMLVTFDADRGDNGKVFGLDEVVKVIEAYMSAFATEKEAFKIAGFRIHDISHAFAITITRMDRIRLRPQIR